MEKISKSVIDEIEKVIIGKKEVVKKIWMTMLANGHILLEDIPGVGKTTLALAFSKVAELDFNRIQFTPDVVASDITGFTIYDKNQGEFVFKPGAVMCNVLLADELNRTTSRTQSALLEVMEEKRMTVDGKTYSLPKPFHVIATQNPIGSYGTEGLPQSQMDRFMLKTSIGYPDFESQIEILEERQTENPIDSIESQISQADLIKLQESVANTHISREILKYITLLTEATRKHASIVQGVSPRGALALSRIVKAKAFVEGRDFVLPEDVQELFVEVCLHRMILDHKAQMESTSGVNILNEILASVQTPDQTLLKI